MSGNKDAPSTGEGVVLGRRNPQFVYDYPGFTELLEYYERGEHLPDND